MQVAVLLVFLVFGWLVSRIKARERLSLILWGGRSSRDKRGRQVWSLQYLELRILALIALRSSRCQRSTTRLLSFHD